jgi:hypothetical protein
MGLRDKLRRLQRAAEGNLYPIPQRDGTTVYATEEDFKAAYMNFCDRLGAGEDAPEEHWLFQAVRNSSDIRWQRPESVYYVPDPEEVIRPIEDLSE